MSCYYVWTSKNPTRVEMMAESREEAAQDEALRLRIRGKWTDDTIVFVGVYEDDDEYTAKFTVRFEMIPSAVATEVRGNG